jgi:hypothetical protein
VHAAAETPLAEALADEARGLLGTRSKGFVTAAMQLEDGSHCITQTLQRLAAVSTLGVAPSVARVNLLLGVHKEDHERQVVIELKEVQVQRVDARQADADELLGKVFDALQTDNLPVKLSAVRSRHAPQDHQERLASLARQSLAFLE